MTSLMVATSVASAGIGLAGQVQAANVQNEYYEQNAKAANAAAADSYSYQQNRLIQERAAASQNLTESALKAAEARASARVAAGEAGVTGLSVDALVGDYYAREGRRASSIQQNFDMSRDYIAGEGAATEARTQSRISSVRTAEVGFLDVLGAGVKAASGSLNAGTYYQKATRKGGGYTGLELE